MKKHARLVTGLFVLLALGCIWAYHIRETRQFEESLRKEANLLIDAPGASGDTAHPTTAVVAAGRTIPIVGDVWGKVSVFTRLNNAEGGPAYHGIDYFYAYEDGSWRITESSGCAGHECQIHAEKAFEAMSFADTPE